MTIATALRAHLLADAAIAALVGTRIYPLRLPQKPQLPAIVLLRVSDVRPPILRGQASVAQERFQVDAWATTFDGATALGTLCRRRLEGYSGTWSDGASPETTVDVAIQFESDRDLFEEEINGGLCRHSADYFIWHTTAGGVV